MSDKLHPPKVGEHRYRGGVPNVPPAPSRPAYCKVRDEPRLECRPDLCCCAPSEKGTPLSRSACALPANIRRTLEESNLPIEVATAIADLVDQRDTWEAMCRNAKDCLTLPEQRAEAAESRLSAAVLAEREAPSAMEDTIQVPRSSAHGMEAALRIAGYSGFAESLAKRLAAAPAERAAAGVTVPREQLSRWALWFEVSADSGVQATYEDGSDTPNRIALRECAAQARAMLSAAPQSSPPEEGTQK